MNQEMEMIILKSLNIVENAYYAIFQLEPLNMEIILVDKISNQKNDETRGVMIPPKTIDGKFSIKIKQNYCWDCLKQNDWQWAGTLTHEMTHVYDYFNYVKMNGLENYAMVQYEFIHRPFVLWTEFNARKIGYFFVRLFTFGKEFDDAAKQNQIDCILETEFPYQLEKVSKVMKSSNETLDNKLYEVMQFMGRYCVWEQLFPEIFNEEFRKRTFDDDMFLNLYDFLVNHLTLEDANKDFDEMLNIIQMNFGGYRTKTF